MTHSAVSRAPRIFLGPVEFAGYYRDLAQGFADLGVFAKCGFFEPHRFGYETAHAWGSPLLSAVQRIGIWRRRYQGPIPKLGLRLAQAALRTAVLIEALFTFDTFILASGNAFWPSSRDLLILRLFGKNIITVHHGSDFRPPVINGFFLKCFPSLSEGVRAAIKETERRQRVIRRIQRHSHEIIGSPLSSSQLFTRRQAIFQIVGIPTPPALPATLTSEARAPKEADRSLRILHAPSTRSPKGSDEIRRVVDQLQAEGYPIDLLEIYERPNAEVIKALQSCDLVIDELYSDTYMASFAKEAASFGKCAIVGGFGWDVLDVAVPLPDRAPTVVIAPADLSDCLRSILGSQLDFRTRGNLSRAFVDGPWSAVAVASRFLRLLDNAAPSHWFFEPANYQYVCGVGLSEQELDDVCRIVAELPDSVAVQLMPRQDLRALMLERVAR